METLIEQVLAAVKPPEPVTVVQVQEHLPENFADLSLDDQCTELCRIIWHEIVFAPEEAPLEEMFD